MRRHPKLARPTRPGFTLVELLVVIAIIAVLISLTAAAVFRVRERATELQVRNDITQMQTSIQAFCSKNQIDFIPSRIVLREDGQYGTNANATIAQWELQSLAYLKRLWPRLVTGPSCLGHDWNGDGQITVGDTGAFVLEGDQCIVFFLGGIQVLGAAQGFGVNKSYPANVNVNLPNSVPKSKSESPFFDFATDRLVIQGDPLGTGRSNQFRSYLDPFGSAYAYFASRGGFGGATGQYNPDCSGLLGKNGVGTTVANGGPPSFYWEGTPLTGAIQNRPYNRDGFQIICAGKDGVFATPFQGESFITLQVASGQRMYMNNAQGSPPPSAGLPPPPYQDVGNREAHFDDFSNFSQLQLGGGTQ
jgi:prepilin-type N-terminal cleavage/methylation domain-containing protein